MKVRYVRKGAHYHVQVFTAPSHRETFALCGELVFSEAEWPDVRRIFSLGGAMVQVELQQRSLDMGGGG